MMSPQEREILEMFRSDLEMRISQSTDDPTITSTSIRGPGSRTSSSDPEDMNLFETCVKQ